VAFEFKLPELGEGIQEAQVLTWKVRPGQAVRAFDVLCEVESAKAAVELTSPVAGTVIETRFAEGDVAHRGDTLVVLDTAEDGAGVSEPEWFGIVGSAPVAARPPAPSPGNRVRAAPLVRKLARERGIDLERVAGSGPQGRVRVADLDAAAAPASSSAAAPGSTSAAPAATGRTPPAVAAAPPTSSTLVTAETPSTTVVPLRGLRKTIADHMLQAWQHAPQVTSMDFLDVTELVRAREVLLSGAQAEGVRLTYLPFFVKAAIQALRAVPEANAIVDEAQQAIVLRHEYHIGIATAVPDGLVVPVVRHADRLSLLEIAREIERLVGAAREKRSAPGDQVGSTFTITSFGGLPGSALFATPILNYPEVAILGLGRIDLQPRVVDGAVVARQCIGASFTFDHRVLDGEAAGRFTAALKRFVEQPLELLLRMR
jgi:pyruvate dehydrogenase E2 component (dihydrolipoyllysine-residue acetyltransferase)